MAIQLINCSTTLPRYSLRTELDDNRYLLDFEWNDRADCWFLGVYTDAGDPILQSVRVIVKYPLLDNSRDPRLPPGLLYAQDTSETDTDPAREDLGARVQLVYMPVVDMPPDLIAAREARRLG